MVSAISLSQQKLAELWQGEKSRENARVCVLDTDEDADESADIKPVRTNKKKRPPPMKDDEDDVKPGGDGVVRWPNGDTYSGDMVDGRPDGTGVMKWANGDEYSGEWRNGKRHGAGKVVFADGTEQSGTWRADHLGKWENCSSSLPVSFSCHSNQMCVSNLFSRPINNFPIRYVVVWFSLRMSRDVEYRSEYIQEAIL